MIVSENAFVWFATVMIAGLCVGWTAWDGRLLIKLWPERKERHDEFFGSIMGLVMVAIGVVGLVKYHLSL